jgi:hypothetical protein
MVRAGAAARLALVVRVSGDSVISLKQSVHSDLALTWSSNDSTVVRAISTDANSPGV